PWCLACQLAWSGHRHRAHAPKLPPHMRRMRWKRRRSLLPASRAKPRAMATATSAHISHFIPCPYPFVCVKARFGTADYPTEGDLPCQGWPGPRFAGELPAGAFVSRNIAKASLVPDWLCGEAGPGAGLAPPPGATTPGGPPGPPDDHEVLTGLPEPETHLC